MLHRVAHPIMSNDEDRRWTRRTQRKTGSRCCARSCGGQASMDFSCRAPMRIRASTCRPRRSASPGSPASPARPGSRSCSCERAALFTDGRYTLQAQDQVDAEALCAAPRERAAGDDLARRQPAEGGGARLRPVAAHAARARALPRGGRARGRQPACVGREPDRRDLDRSSGAAAGARRAARAALCRRRTRPTKRREVACGAGQGCDRRRRPHRARIRSPGSSTSAAATCRTRRWR